VEERIEPAPRRVEQGRRGAGVTDERQHDHEGEDERSE
jgi:hypothetical protein